MEKTVFSGLVVAWRFATWPTSRSPSFVKATTEGVRRPPSALATTTGSPTYIIATTELVVPRSMPITFGMFTPPDKFWLIYRQINRLSLRKIILESIAVKIFYKSFSYFYSMDLSSLGNLLNGKPLDFPG